MNGQYRLGDIVLGNWTLTRLLGEGSFGRVFEAEREDFGTIYKSAVKVITIPQNQAEVKNAREEGMSEDSLIAYFRSFVEEVVQEFSLMSRLEGTANIVSYKDHMVVSHSGKIGWDILIRMELLTPIQDYTSEHSFTRKDVIKVGMDLCRALELCQKFNVIHRDIKPENIFVSELGDYKLGDFGIARTVEKTTSGLSKKGTYTYMAPEIYRGDAYGSSVDIYSLGIVLYRLLNDNRAPFLPDYPAPITHSAREAALAKRISGAVLPPPKNADGRLAEIVLKACAYDPKERYSSPMQMREELKSIQYSKEEAPVIYPQGDETPQKSADYVDEIALQKEKPDQDNTVSMFKNVATESKIPIVPIAGETDKTDSMFRNMESNKETESMSGNVESEKANIDTDKTEEKVDEVDSFNVTDFSVYNNGEYVVLGSYKGKQIKWIIYDCDSGFCRLLCEDSLYRDNYTTVWEESEIRKELNSDLFFEMFTPEQQKGFIPRDGDMLSISSVNDFYLMESNLGRKQIKSKYDSWLKEKKFFMSLYGWINELNYQDNDLELGIRPICRISIGKLEVTGGSGDKNDPYILDSSKKD